MGIDYEGLYANDYFGHQPGARSFQAGFPGLLVAVAKGLGCGGVVDAGAGNGELARELAASGGLYAVPVDLRRDDAAGVLPFDLTSREPAQLDRLRSEAGPRLHGAHHLTTCLDVLEHVDRADLAAALLNLRELTAEWLLVSVSTRPSSRDNLYHATIVPRRTWRRLFDAAGFDVEPHPGVEGMSYRLPYPDGDPFWCMNQWRRVDPFGDSAGPEPYYLLLRKRAADPDPAAAAERIGAILCLPLAGPGSLPELHPETHLTFLIGHYQDFHHYRPFWEAIDRRSVSVLVRTGALRAIEPRRYAAILAYLRCRGIRYREVQSVREVDWADTPGSRRALIVATESTVLDSHLLNGAFVLAAQAECYRTFQIQHGIWPHAEYPFPVAFSSQHVLTWSDDFAAGFERHFPRSRRDGSPGRPRYTVTGCPKFDDNADTRPLTPADLLGEWAEAYSRSVLVATNLHWPQNHRGAEVVPALIELAERRPDTLFACKLHPVHDVDGQLLGQLPPNLRVLDEFACLFADLETPRLLRAFDATISTPSTIVLEAALAGRPFAVIDTANPNGMVGVEPVSIRELDAEVGRLLDPGRRAEAIARHEPFRDHYFDRSLLGHGLARVVGTIEEDLASSETGGSRTDPSLLVARSFAASFSAHYTIAGRARAADLERQLAEAQARGDALQSGLELAEARYREELARLREELAAARQGREAARALPQPSPGSLRVPEP